MNSIHRKLGIGLATGISLLWLLATLVSGLIVKYELGEAADSALRVTAHQLLAIVPAKPASASGTGSGSASKVMPAVDGPTLLPAAAVVGPAGAGLGLAIAETIATHAGITLQLRSPASVRDGGFEATLSAG